MFSQFCLGFLTFVSLSYCGNTNLEIIENGGYNSLFCFNLTSSSTTMTSSNTKINCTKSTAKCHSGNLYKCKLQCVLKITPIKVNGKFMPTIETKKPEFKLPKEKYFNNNMNITFTAQNGSAVHSISPEDIHIKFSENDVFCKQFWISRNSIICFLTVSKKNVFFQTLNVSVSIGYGNLSCNPPRIVGHILIGNNYIYYIIFIPMGFIVISLLIGFLVYFRIFKAKTVSSMNRAYSTEIVQKEMKYIKLNKMAFLEYQTAMDSFANLGRLHEHHILSFNNFISRTLNVELHKSEEDKHDEDLENIKSYLLNKKFLLKWIEDLNNSKRAQERSLIASLLTIILFQHPKYFIQIIKDLIKQLVIKMKDKSEEKLLFRRSEALVEKMIGNWITMCMYQSLKTGEIGKRFFNLCRAIKCKIESGIIDVYTKKSKFGLSYDQLLIGNLDYDVLTIQADVEVQFKMINSANGFIDIKLKNLSIEVLSLDTISQVKAKILDRAFMEHYELDNKCSYENSGIDLNNNDKLFLYFLSSSSKLLLSDFDSTNDSTVLDKEYIRVNTFKHFNIQSGSKFLLCSKSENDLSSFSRISSQGPKKPYVHLQTSHETISPNFDLKFPSLSETNSKKPSVELISENINKESCLMLILATKKSLNPFIDGFFQSIFNWKFQNHFNSSSNSLFESFSENQIFFNTEDNYLLFVYYFFSMLDDIAKQLGITDQETTQIWKSNSFILRFWINLIKNPNFIFSIDRTDYIETNLTTIASVLMQSCSVGMKHINIDSPIITLLFPQEIQNKYSQWWKYFANCTPFVNEEDIISMMTNIIEKSDIQNNYNSSLRSLLTISKGLNIQFPSEDMDLKD